jgi:hypothetical protein
MNCARNPCYVFAVFRRVCLSSKKLYQTCESFTVSALTSESARPRPHYLLVIGATVNRALETKRNTAHVPPSVFRHFQKQNPQWLGYECHLNRANFFFQRGINAAWLLHGEPSSDHAVPTAAICSVRGSARSELVHTAHNRGCHLYELHETDMFSFLIFVQCVSVRKQTEQYKFEQCLWHDQHLGVSTTFRRLDPSPYSGGEKWRRQVITSSVNNSQCVCYKTCHLYHLVPWRLFGFQVDYLNAETGVAIPLQLYVSIRPSHQAGFHKRKLRCQSQNLEAGDIQFRQ